MEQAVIRLSDPKRLVPILETSKVSKRSQSRRSREKFGDIREGRCEGMRRGCHLSADLSLLQQAAHTVRA